MKVVGTGAWTLTVNLTPTNPPSSKASTVTVPEASGLSVSVLALQFLGAGHEAQVKKSLAFIGDKRYRAYKKVVADHTQWETDAGQCLYGWYYDTQAIFNDQMASRERKARWKRWRAVFEPALKNAQHRDGYWQTNGHHGIGAHHTAGRVLSTALCILQLEVYYRYLPSLCRKKDMAELVQID